MKIKCDRVRYGRSNLRDYASACVGIVGHDHDLHRAVKISQIEDGLGQIHFFPGGGENGGIKNLFADLTNRLVPTVDFCNKCPGSSKMLLDPVTVLGANQQGFFETPQHLTTQNENNEERLSFEASRCVRARIQQTLARTL